MSIKDFLDMRDALRELLSRTDGDQEPDSGKVENPFKHDERMKTSLEHLNAVVAGWPNPQATRQSLELALRGIEKAINSMRRDTLEGGS